jgi:hypothetical protein
VILKDNAIAVDSTVSTADGTVDGTISGTINRAINGTIGVPVGTIERSRMVPVRIVGKDLNPSDGRGGSGPVLTYESALFQVVQCIVDNDMRI